MDDALREKILASLDHAPDSASDPAVARALEQDPEARGYAAGLYRIDAALRSWPLAVRSEAAWAESEARVLAVIAAAAKVRGAGRVPPGETDDLAPPTFDDDSTSMMETRPAMSEPNEHDPDLENLAALTRTSLAPGAVPSVRAPSSPSIADATDDTSSGIVDIKQLSALARDAAASAPPPAKAAEPVVEAAKPAAAEAAKPKADARPAAKKDDVMVTAKPAAVVAPEPPRRAGGGPLWAIGGMAVMAGAFLIYNASRDSSPTSPSAVESNAPVGAVPEAVPQAAPTPTAEPAPAAPMPEAAPVAVVAPAVVPPPPVAAPAPEPAAEAAPQPVARSASRAPHAAAAARTIAPTAPAAPVVAAPAPTPAARPAAAPAPTPAAAPRGGPAPAPAAGRATSVDDLLNRAAPTAAPASAAPAPAAAADLPERLGRAQITGVLSPLNGAVRSCAQGQTGTAPVSIVIGNDGAVRTATVSGQFAGTPVGECIAGVVRRAHFPAFRAATQNLMFPYVITPPTGR